MKVNIITANENLKTIREITNKTNYVNQKMFVSINRRLDRIEETVKIIQRPLK